MTAQLQLTIASLTLFHLTDINTFILNNNGTPLLAHERDPLPEFLRDMQQSNCRYLMNEALRSTEQCCLFTNEMGLTYLAKMIHFNKEEPKV